MKNLKKKSLKYKINKNRRITNSPSIKAKKSFKKMKGGFINLLGSSNNNSKEKVLIDAMCAQVNDEDLKKSPRNVDSFIRTLCPNSKQNLSSQNNGILGSTIGGAVNLANNITGGNGGLMGLVKGAANIATYPIRTIVGKMADITGVSNMLNKGNNQIDPNLLAQYQQNLNQANQQANHHENNQVNYQATLQDNHQINNQADNIKTKISNIDKEINKLSNKQAGGRRKLRKSIKKKKNIKYNKNKNNKRKY